MSSAFNQPDENVINAGPSRKRKIMPHELQGKFKSKGDFIKYFKEICK